MNENREGDQVTGQYQYVDPYGSLIIVRYTAGAMGYTETREVQDNFVKINPRPQRPAANTGASFSAESSTGSSFSSGSGSSSSFGSGSTSSFGSGSSSNFGSGSSFNSGSSSSSSFNANDIVNAVVSQVTPLVSGVVSNAVS